MEKDSTLAKSTSGAVPRKSKLRIAYGLLRNYGLDRITGKPSTAGFWWLKEVARVTDTNSFNSYINSAAPSPFYLMNYESKLSFDYQNSDGITVLPYAPPIGDQINPEAAFIYALALHDDFHFNKNTGRQDEFLSYAEYFEKAQLENGDWPYYFDWPNCPSPWVSALAQGRGASVMLRAYLITDEKRYKTAAIKAISQFEVHIENGGYLAIHPLAKLPYYEEYPSWPTGVMNGFMASLLGCWEVSHWLKDNHTRHLFTQGIDTLIEMTPHYLTSWWSVYSKNPEIKSHNYNTPRYHKLVLSYFEILAELSNNSQIAAQRDKWKACLGPVNETRALVAKFVWKLKYGIFSS